MRRTTSPPPSTLTNRTKHRHWPTKTHIYNKFAPRNAPPGRNRWRMCITIPSHQEKNETGAQRFRTRGEKRRRLSNRSEKRGVGAPEIRPPLKDETIKVQKPKEARVTARDSASTDQFAGAQGSKTGRTIRGEPCGFGLRSTFVEGGPAWPVADGDWETDGLSLINIAS